MSEEGPNKPQNGESDESSGSKSSEKYRSNSSFNGSLNVNIRSLGLNTELTFGNRTTASRDARSIKSGTPCPCQDRTEHGAPASQCACRRSSAGNQFNPGLQHRALDNAEYNSKKGHTQKNSKYLNGRQHSWHNDTHEGTSNGSLYAQQSAQFSGTRPKQKNSTSSDFRHDFYGAQNSQVMSQTGTSENYFRDPLDHQRSFENVSQRYDDAITQEELELILGHSSVSGRSEPSELSYLTGDVAKVSDNMYDLNGLKLSPEELQFVLDQSSPVSGFERPAHSSDRIGCSRPTNESFMNQDMSRRENGAQPTDFLHAGNGHKRQTMFRQHPISSVEKLLASSSLELLELPWADDEDLSKCPICLGNLQNDSPAQTSSNTARGLVGAVMLANCGHAFHCSCLLPLLTTASESFSCPLCRTLHGTLTGTQPPGGTMSTSVQASSLPGFETAKTIVILYGLPEGVQGPGHPHPGQPYHLKGFPRKAYLPDTPKGREVASLLKKAFDRRLVFTVGRSESVGLDDCVIWGNISHKTLVKDKKFGFPDPHYLDNVMLELAALGIRGNS